MLAILIPVLNSVLGGVIKPFVSAWTDYERAKLTTGVAGFEKAAEADAKIMQAALVSDVQLAALKVQVYGTTTYRIITLIAGLPPAVHFGLVFIDTILASKAFLGEPYFGVPKLPSPYDTFEWAVVSSFFLVHAFSAGKSNVAAWLGRKN
ncbi:MAG: hypothetical protein ACREBU_26565 [Nitrososphaera sp.]